jgi:hypothetical protein
MRFGSFTDDSSPLNVFDISLAVPPDVTRSMMSVGPLT